METAPVPPASPVRRDIKKAGAKGLTVSARETSLKEQPIVQYSDDINVLTGWPVY
jgi:hypothetical protein